MIRGTIVVLNRGWICTALTQWLWGLDRHAYAYEPVVGGEIAHGRNRGALRLQGEWLLFVDSDCVPEPGALERLEQSPYGITAGVILERGGALEVCATRTFEPTVRYGLGELVGQPRPVLAAGTGCMLIRRPVLEAVPRPWFRCGQLVPEFITEDTEWCLRAAEHGYPTYIDPAVRVGHAMRGVLWPGEDGEPWVSWEGAVGREPLEAVGCAA